MSASGSTPWARASRARWSRRPRPLAPPAADAEVRVVALREDPAVAAAGRRRARPPPCRGSARGRAVPGDVALERDAAHDALAETGRLRDDAVRAVGADEHAAATGRRRPSPRRRRRRARGPRRARRRGRSRRPRPPARRGRRRAGGAASSGSAARSLVALERARSEPELEAVDDVLDDRVDRARQPARSARPVSPPPHGLSRGKRALSASSTLAPPRARWIAVAEPAGPAPTTRRRSAPRSRRLSIGHRPTIAIVSRATAVSFRSTGTDLCLARLGPARRPTRRKVDR